MATVAPLYREGVQYALAVSEPTPLLDGTLEYRVDVIIGEAVVTHAYVSRTTHLVADMWEVIDWAVDTYLQGRF